MTDERSRVLAELGVSRETSERLDLYAALLTKWNPAINLVASSTIRDMWTRHFLDSAQVLKLAPSGTNWVDIGTGGGFPGIVVAILAKETCPDLTVTCVESDQRKATFLRTVARDASLDVQVISERIEAVEPQNADILSARALAPLGKLLEFADFHLSSQGRALFLKGASHAEEIAEALEKWSFQVDTYPSKTNPNAVVLSLGDIARV